MLKTKVIIDGITIKDDDGAPDPKLMFTYDFERIIFNAISEVTIRVPKIITDTVTLDIGKTVEIFRGFTTSTDSKRFSGFIADFKPDGGVIVIKARDKTWDLVRKRVNKIYDSATDPSAGKISEIAKDLIETFGGLTANVVDTGTDPGRVIAQFKCINANVFSRLLELAKAVNYQIWHNASTDKVNFEPRGFNSTGKTLTVKTELISVPTWDYNSDQLVNNIRVEGATVQTNLRFPVSGTGKIGTTTDFDTDKIVLPKTPETVKLTIDASDPPTTLREGGSKDGATGNFYFVDKENKAVKPSDTTGSFTTDDFAFIDYKWASPIPIVMLNETSISKFRETARTMNFSDISSIADAEARALEILARFSTPFISGETMLKTDSTLDFQVGDEVTVVDNISNPTVNRLLVITRKVEKYPGVFESITLGDEILRLADWQLMTEDRIKRLEEELLRNQDLVFLHMQFTNDTDDENARIWKPLYKKRITQAYTTADNTMIWDSPTFGIWNTDNWATDANPDGVDAEVEEFVQSFTDGVQDIHTENFVFADFKDTANTTATWTTGGSAVFTSGQKATSTSIDLNNGTITKATLTASATMIAHYLLNDKLATATTVVLDNVGSNDGTLNGGDNTEDKSVSGKIIQAFSMNGTDDFINIDNVLTNSLFATTKGTWAIWVKPVDATPASIDILISFNDTNANEFIHIRIKTAGQFLAKATKAGVAQWTLETDAVAFSDNTYAHVAITHDGTAPVLYLNGVAVAQTFTGSLDKTAWFSALTGLDNGRIADRSVNSGGETNHFNGEIDDVRIYDRDLTSAEILSIYNSGNGTEGEVGLVPGSFTYEMAANGTSFETVTSGVLHTFATSGNDLRWRATENAASTGEISKIVVEEYH